MSSVRSLPTLGDLRCYVLNVTSTSTVTSAFNMLLQICGSSINISTPIYQGYHISSPYSKDVATGNVVTDMFDKLIIKKSPYTLPVFKYYSNGSVQEIDSVNFDIVLTRNSFASAELKRYESQLKGEIKEAIPNVAVVDSAIWTYDGSNNYLFIKGTFCVWLSYNNTNIMMQPITEVLPAV